MHVMSDWRKIESKYAREISAIRNIVSQYSYKDKDAKETDKILRSVLISCLREAKTLITDLMVPASKEDTDSATRLKGLKDDIDLAINEIEVFDYWKFPEEEALLEKIVKADHVLCNNTNLFLNSCKSLQNFILTTGSQDIEIQLENLRKNLNNLRALFLERADVIKIKK